MPTKSNRYPIQFQYLGQVGTTYPCVEAMVTILTSPYRCREITVLYSKEEPRDKTYAVCFVIWDWLGTEITIVPDGFGTHGGTGGWGLEVVLALIQFYQIPLKEKFIKYDQFERITFGRPTSRDLQQLHQADFGAPSWPLHVGEFGSALWSQITYETAQFPYRLIAPELLNDVKDVERNPGTAVFQAARKLEMLLRSLDPSFADLDGQTLVNKALGEGRPFEPKGATISERQAWTHLFRGVVGAIRNPESHRDQQLKMEDAIGQILTVNMLLRKLKADYPDQFRAAESAMEDEEDWVEEEVQ